MRVITPRSKPSILMHHLAIFASGNGSNARKILKYFEHHPAIRVGAIVTNNPQAGVIRHAQEFGVPLLLIDKSMLHQKGLVTQLLKDRAIDWVILAGFLLLIPPDLVEAYPDRMLNIHPALLPKYGGKGMYGMHVHQAVKDAGDSETGITIHFVNTRYDEGHIYFQARCDVEESDTPEDIAHKIHELEYRHFAPIIEKAIRESENYP